MSNVGQAATGGQSDDLRGDSKSLGKQTPRPLPLNTRGSGLSSNEAPGTGIPGVSATGTPGNHAAKRGEGGQGGASPGEDRVAVAGHGSASASENGATVGGGASSTAAETSTPVPDAGKSEKDNSSSVPGKSRPTETGSVESTKGADASVKKEKKTKKSKKEGKGKGKASSKNSQSASVLDSKMKESPALTIAGSVFRIRMEGGATMLMDGSEIVIRGTTRELSKLEIVVLRSEGQASKPKSRVLEEKPQPTPSVAKTDQAVKEQPPPKEKKAKKKKAKKTSKDSGEVQSGEKQSVPKTEEPSAASATPEGGGQPSEGASEPNITKIQTAKANGPSPEYLRVVDVIRRLPETTKAVLRTLDSSELVGSLPELGIQLGEETSPTAVQEGLM